MPSGKKKNASVVDGNVTSKKGKNVVELVHAKKVYEIKGGTAVTALKDINITIKKGELISVRGPSGCGKSTLLNLIGALDVPSSGSVMIDGKDTKKMSSSELARIRRSIGFVFQYFNLIPRLTAYQNVELPMIIQRKLESDQRRKKVMELLRLVGLATRRDHNPLQLSGGQQQRVAIARALAQNPSFLLMDEPTGNVDSKARDQIMMLVKKLNRLKKITTIIVTHDPEISAMTDRVISLFDGELVGNEIQESRDLEPEEEELVDYEAENGEKETDEKLNELMEGETN